MIKTLYRISDSRDGKTNIEGVTKKQCFLNFIKVFGTSDLTVIADNAKQKTIEFLKSFTDNIHTTSLGNANSFMYALDLAIKNDDNQTVYLVEDDYLHLQDSETIITEGIERAHYVSLYDHLDKYISPGQNPFVYDGGEDTKLILTDSTHWKYTNSTTMTFASKVRTLKEDYDVIRQHCVTKRPADFPMFCALRKLGKKLITPIPGRSTHCDHFPSPFFFRHHSLPVTVDQPV